VSRNADELPEPNAPGREEYATALAGEKVSVALQAMSDAFAFVGLGWWCS